MNKPDWTVHYILDDIGPGGIINVHTHGMERYGHLDFQTVLPIAPEKATVLLNTIGFEVQNGRKFEPGDYGDDSHVYSCAFRLEQHRETGRDVLRLIFPDPQFRFPEDPLCEKPYKYQTETAFEE